MDEIDTDPDLNLVKIQWRSINAAVEIRKQQFSDEEKHRPRLIYMK